MVVLLENYYTPDEEADLEPAPGRQVRPRRGLSRGHPGPARRAGRLCSAERGAGVAHTYVDAGPVPERELAQRAGLGWIGKNTMLIRPGAGSFFFIGTDLHRSAAAADQPVQHRPLRQLHPLPRRLPHRCASSSRDVLDATRCISYLTIEQRGPIPDGAAERSCRATRSAATSATTCVPGTSASPSLRRSPSFARRWKESDDIGFFENMTEAEFTQTFGCSPLERAGLEGMRRNYRAVFAGAQAGSQSG